MKASLNARPDESLSSTAQRQPLPSGRFLYAEAERQLYDVYRSNTAIGLWISTREYPSSERAAGPFDPNDALRALRLANLSIPDGCELGPWQTGLGFFELRSMPGSFAMWSKVDPQSLPPSITRYEYAHVTGEARGCCAPPTSAPKVQWEERQKGVLAGTSEENLEGILTRAPVLARSLRGLLKHAWNGHPQASLLFASGKRFDGGFYVVDLAPA